MPDLYGAIRLKHPLRHLKFGDWPTPLRRLNGLSSVLSRETWVKCDHTAVEYCGGNKVRKLEFVLADAKSTGARTLLTIGGLGSHQVTATGILGKKIGMDAAAIVYPRPVTPWVRANTVLWGRAGMRLLCIEDIGELESGFQAAKTQLKPPIYLIPSGGSSSLGNFGCVQAGWELALQVAAQPNFKRNVVVVAAGTGGTVAGLALGLGLYGSRSIRLVAVRCAEAGIGTLSSIHQQVHGLKIFLERQGGSVPQVRLPNLQVIDSEGSHGVATPKAMEIIELARQSDGLPLEPTYTGRALAALYRIPPDERERVIFWHTGGSLSPSSFHLEEYPSAIRHWLL